MRKLALMKSFVVKALIASIIFFVLFEIMIGSRLDIVQNYLELGKDKAGRMKIKNKELYKKYSQRKQGLRRL